MSSVLEGADAAAVPLGRTSLRLQILGPLRIWRGDVELDAGPRQQARLLALLLARHGRPTSSGELLDLMWGEDAPPSALNVISKYIGALRRQLEPAVPARGSGTYLLRRGDGYLCAAGPGVLDLATFREQLRAARAAVAAERLLSALDHYEEALALWNGPAGDGIFQGVHAAAVFARVNDEYFDAGVAAAELAVPLCQAERFLPFLHRGATMAPFHEPVQASRMLLLAAAGQQAEALSVYGAVRSRLADELGMNPGPALQAAHHTVLSQATPESTRGTTRAVRDLVPRASPTSPTSPHRRDPATPSAGLIGRRDELGILRRAVAPVFDAGSATVLIEGEPGAGKTRLLEEVAAHAERRRALVTWGHCLEGEGTPALWPWSEAVRGILDALPPETRQPWLDGDLGHLVGRPGDPRAALVAPHDDAQFRLFEEVARVMAAASSQTPLVIVIDDLQWADRTSLQLLDHVAGRLPPRAAIVGALRNRPAPGPELGRTLAAVSRLAGHRRVPLGPLVPGEVAELVRRETGQDITSGTARSIHARTAGNAFFVRELSRLLATSGPLTEALVMRGGVPVTVRDVVRDRTAGLGAASTNLLQAAALIGRHVELALLPHVVDQDLEACLTHLEPIEAMGLLGPTPGDPFSYRFTHDLVREAVCEAIPSTQIAATHLRIADALEHRGTTTGSIAERVAHHLWASGPLASATRTVVALMRAGRSALAKTALVEAERQLRSAAELARAAARPELELSALSQLGALAGMRSMYGTSSLGVLARAEELARRLGREREAAGFLYSRWAAHSQGIELRVSGPLARRLLDRGAIATDPVVRAYGLQAWGIHQWNLGHVGEAFRHLSRSDPALLRDLAARDDDPVGHDLQFLMAGMLAETTALHGDLDGARGVLDRLAGTAGDGPYANAVEATFTARIAVLAGDPQSALCAAERGIAADQAFSFEFLGTYQRLARCWALAVTGADPAGEASRAEQLIERNLLDPPRSCVATWYGLLAEMWLAAGALDDAARALDQADTCLRRYGQRYPESLLLLIRARLLRASGAPGDTVRRCAERAEEVAAEDEAWLVVQRAERFPETLSSPPDELLG